MATFPGFAKRQGIYNQHTAIEERRELQVIKVDQGIGNRVYIHCRNDDGQRIILDVDGHRPMFYGTKGPAYHGGIMQVEPGYTSIDGGQKLTKYICKTPRVVRDIRDMFEDIHEADIPYTQRFMVDVPVNGRIRAPAGLGGITRVKVEDIEMVEAGRAPRPVRAWWDIETGPDAIDDVDNARSPLYCIGLRHEQQWHYWYWHPIDKLPEDYQVESKVTSEKIRARPDYQPIIKPELHAFTEERPMLMSFVRWMRENQPDVLNDWFGSGFDVPYTINRCRHLGIDDRSWGWGGCDARGATLPGVQHIDLYEIHKKASQSVLKSNSLKAVAEDVAGIYLEKEPGNIERWWKKDLKSLADYNMWDVESTWAIDVANSYTEWALEYAFFAGVDNVMDVTKASIVIDVLCLQDAKAHGICLPRKPHIDRKDRGKKKPGFTGGKVRSPEVGVHDNVMVIDFSAMYPNIIIGANLSYETLVGTVEYPQAQQKQSEQMVLGEQQPTMEVASVDNPYKNRDDLIHINIKDAENNLVRTHYFDTSYKGMMPRIADHLFTLRRYYDRMMKEAKDPAEKAHWKNLRKPIKECMNAQFGVMGYRGFRLYRKEVSESITALGRRLVDAVCDHIEAHFGYKVIYSDTDSAMVKVPGEDVIQSVVDESNQFIVDEATRWGLLNPDRFELDYECLYKRYLQGPKKDSDEGAKKRYAALVTVEDWNPCEPYIKIAGFEYKRSETPPVTAELQMEMFRRILVEGAGSQELFEYVSSVYLKVRDGKYPIQHCLKRPKLGQHLADYKVNSEVKAAADYSNTFLDRDFRKDDRVYILPIAAVTGPYPKPPKGFIGLHEWEQEPPDGFSVDWQELANKMVKEKSSGIFQLLGAKGKEQGLDARGLETWF